MKTNSIVITVIAIAAVVFGAWAFVGMKKSVSVITNYEQCVAAGYPVMESYPEQCKTPDGQTFVHDISGDMKDLIRVDTPQANEAVATPLIVTGEARGSWYFEASFPVRLLDADGILLAQVPAQAQGEWMTENFVPFKAQLTFGRPNTQTGTLVLRNDNPSGDPARDKDVRIPVRFATVAADGSAPFSSNGAPYSFAIGQSRTFPDGLKVTLNSINDSRCKPGVQCIWAGELAPELSLTGGRFLKSVQKIQLGTVNNAFIEQKNYGFSLKSATPTSADIVIVSGSSSGTSGVSGYVHVGPTCPVQRMPPDPQCNDRPFVGLISLKKNNVVLEEGLTKNGQFTFAVVPGTYSVTAGEIDSVYPRCEEASVTVKTGQFTKVDISCDSGIR